MSQFLALRRAVLFLTLALPSLCWGLPPNALIVNDGTLGINADVTANLSADLVLAGYTVTTNTGVPGGSLATYGEVWDVRYNVPLTSPDITAYLGYLAGGGSLFVMGENTGFITRDNSIVSLIGLAGGGTVTIATTLNSQTVFTPFTGPNAITTLTYLAAAGIPTPPGRGSYVTKDVNNVGASVVYPPGSMTNELTGTLITVFDVNFMQTTADANSQSFLKNLIAYLAAPTPIAPAVPFPITPAPSSLLLLLTGLAGVGLAAAKLRARAAVTAPQ